MMKLEGIFKPVFDNHLVIDSRLVKYAEVSLVRMENNNPEEKFTPLIAALRLNLENFKKSLSDKSVLKAQREGSTINVDDLITEFRSKALQREGLIRDTFGVDSKEYQEFYPAGTHEYTVMSKTNADILMRRMVAAYTSHATVLPEPRRLEMEKLYSDYTTARSEQLEKGAGISNKHNEKSQGRMALEKQLQYNLLTIAREYIGQPGMYHTYFEHNLLFPFRHKSLERKEDDQETDDSNYILTVPPMTTLPAEFSINASDVLMLYNEGDVPLTVFAASVVNASTPEGALIIQPDEEKEVAVSTLGPLDSTFLLIANNSSEEGSIEISLI